MYKDFKKSETLDTGFAGGSSLVWMFSGIVLGLLVGLAMYLVSNDRMPRVSMIDTLEKKIQKVQTNSADKAAKKLSIPGKQKASIPNFGTNVDKAVEKERKNKFSYYAVLPNLDVPIGNAKPINTSEDKNAKAATTAETNLENLIAATEEKPVKEKIEKASIGDYLLQVASFKKQSMANKTRGRLNNKGIDAYVQKKKIKGRYWYRVVAGPVDQVSIDDWKHTAEELGHKPLVISVRYIGRAMAKGDSIFENTPLDPSKDKGDAPSLMQGQIAYLYKNKTLGIWSNTILAAILLGFFWFHFPKQHIALLIWFGLIVTLSLVRFMLGKGFKPERQYSQTDLTSWANRHVFFTSLLSTIWGLAGIVFFPTDLVHLTLLIFILFSVLLSSIPTLAASRVAYYFQILVTLAPTCILLFMSRDSGHQLIALAVIVMALTLVLVAGYIYHLLFELQNAQIALQSLADTDQLTGIANRRHFDRKFKVEWRRAMRDQSPISLILVDVDYFKKYNDTYGHQAGDRCLQQIALALESVSHRPADLASRYGGEEFSVLLPSTSQENAAMLAERLRKKVESLKIEHSSSKLGHVTISIGVSCCRPIWDFTGNTPDEDQKVTFPAMLLTAADNALYVAKESGRNQVSEQACGDQKISNVLQKQAEENIPIA